MEATYLSTSVTADKANQTPRMVTQVPTKLFLIHTPLCHPVSQRFSSGVPFHFSPECNLGRSNVTLQQPRRQQGLSLPAQWYKKLTAMACHGVRQKGAACRFRPPGHAAPRGRSPPGLSSRSPGLAIDANEGSLSS